MIDLARKIYQHVRFPQLFLFCFPYGHHFFQPFRMDSPENPEMESYYTFVNRFFLVRPGYLVWLGILCLYALALDVREKLGYHDESDSYIHFLLLKLSGWNADPKLVEKVTLIVFLLALLISVILNIRDYRRKKIKKSNGIT